MALRPAQEPLPLDAYLATSNTTLVNRATETLISICMRRKGFQYTPGSTQARTAASATTAADTPFAQLPYGLVDASRAGHYGYSDPPETDSHRLGMVTQSVAPQTAYARALNGDAAAPGSGPSRGCWEQASSSLQVRIDTADVNLLGELIMRAHEAKPDISMLTADAKWSACMRNAGYDFDTPNDAAAAAWPEAPDQAELAVAKHDVACKQEVMWLETWRTAEAARQMQEARGNSSALQRIEAALADRDDRARAVLGTGSRTPTAQQP